MQKSAIEEIKELKAQLESKTEQAKTDALNKASDAISFLRELGLDNDAILKELGFRGRAKERKSKEAMPPEESRARYAASEQTRRMTEERTAARQTRRRS